MKILENDRYAYRVIWSEEDNESQLQARLRDLQTRGLFQIIRKTTNSDGVGQIKKAGFMGILPQLTVGLSVISFSF